MSDDAEPRMVEVFGTAPTTACIAASLSRAQRFYIEWGIPERNSGTWQMQQALVRKGLLRDMAYLARIGCRLTPLGVAVQDYIKENDMNNDVKVYSVRIGTPKISITEPATAREMKILHRLELLSGDGMGDFGMISRRHLKVSFDAMQVLFFKGLVDGSALRDERGHGNTPDSSLWGITKIGLAAVGYEA